MTLKITLGVWLGVMAAFVSIKGLEPQGEPVSPAALSPDAQAKLLNKVRVYALTYTHNLPDFICLERTRRYAEATDEADWRLIDTITARLSYFNQKEDYKLVSQNGRAAKSEAYESAGGTLSQGDFGTTLRDIFDPASHTTFAWERFAILRGRRTLVFSYRLARPLYKIEYQMTARDLPHKTKVASRGEVFLDADLNTIARITHEAVNIDPSFPVREARETLDYGFIEIGGRQFFLPLSANLEMRVQTYGGKFGIKNEKEFQRYQKFSSEAVIQFDSGQPPPQP